MSGSWSRFPAALRLLAGPRPLGFLARPLSQAGAGGDGSSGGAAASASSRESVERLVRAHPVVVFMKGSPAQPQCGFSNAVVQILRLHGVADYRAYDVLQDPDLRQGQRASPARPSPSPSAGLACLYAPICTLNHLE